MKALGKGIDEDFKYIPCLDGEHNLDFSLIKNSQNWQVRSFDLEDDYLGAIAYEGLATAAVTINLYNVSQNIFALLEMVK